MLPTLMWEFLPSGEERARVIGGWLIRTKEFIMISELDKLSTYQSPVFINRQIEQTTMVYIPDPEYKWDKEIDMMHLIQQEDN